MKRCLLYIALCATFVSVAQAGEQPLPKVTHYGLHLRFLLKEHRIHAEAAITIRNTTNSPKKVLPFVLYRLLQVGRVTDVAGKPLRFEQNIQQFADEPSLQAALLSVKLPHFLQPNDTATIIVTYEGFIFGYPEVMAYVRERIDETYALFRPDAFAYPMLAYASFSSILAAYDTKYTYEIRATVPQGYSAICGGKMVEKRPAEPGHTLFVFRNSIPTWRIDLAVARFSVLTDSAGDLFVYYLPEDSAGAARVLHASQQAVILYGEMFGLPRRYRGYTIIEIPDGWGSQAGDAYLLQAATAFKDSTRVGEVYHEIAHTWNTAPAAAVKRCRYFDEAFASYFEALAIRSFEGEERFLEDMERSRTLFTQWAGYDRRVFDTPIAEYGAKELGRHSYTKGAWSLFVLNRVVGDKTFARIIQAMLEDSRSTGIDFKTFQQLCERTAGRDLKPFFDEWIFGSESSRLLVDGIPIADIVMRY